MWNDVTRVWLAAGEAYREATTPLLRDFFCAYCGESAQTIDHVVPRSAGGEDAAPNLVPACRACNLLKLNKPLDRWVVDLEHQTRGLPMADRRRRRFFGALCVKEYRFQVGFEPGCYWRRPELGDGWQSVYPKEIARAE